MNSSIKPSEDTCDYPGYEAVFRNECALGHANITRKAFLCVLNCVSVFQLRLQSRRHFSVH